MIMLYACIALVVGFLLGRYLPTSLPKQGIPTLDTPEYYPKDAAVPYYTLKWLNNIKYTKKGLLTAANIQTRNEGVITRISFKHSEINIDKETHVNYPFVVRVELNNSKSKKIETLFFSKARYDKAQIFRTGKSGSEQRISWEEIKVGEYATIEENIDLLISNVDDKSNFTDNYLKSLTIHIK